MSTRRKRTDFDARRLANRVRDMALESVMRRGWKISTTYFECGSGVHQLWCVDEAGKRALVISGRLGKSLVEMSRDKNEPRDPDPTEFVVASPPLASLGSQQVSKATVDAIVQKAKSKGIETIFYATNERRTAPAKTAMAAQDIGVRIEYFHSSSLVHDRLEVGTGLPKYSVVAHEDVPRFVQTLGLSADDDILAKLPVTTPDDPVASILGCACGDLIEVRDPCPGVSPRARVVGKRK